MSITYANTLEIDEISGELISLSDEYINEINNLFKRLSEVSTETKEWTGTQSKRYYSIISNDKGQLLEVGNQLKYIGKKIKKDALEIDACIEKCIDEEAKKGY